MDISGVKFMKINLQSKKTNLHQASQIFKKKISKKFNIKMTTNHTKLKLESIWMIVSLVLSLFKMPGI